MAAQRRVRQVMNRQMTRREFLKHMGLGAVFVFGGGALLQFLFQDESHASARQSQHYGSGTYGR